VANYPKNQEKFSMQRRALHLFRFPDKPLIYKAVLTSLHRDPLHLFRADLASLPPERCISSVMTEKTD
jgi:hypothetical protein